MNYSQTVFAGSRTLLISGVVAVALLSTFFFGIGSAHAATLTRSLDIGSSGADVLALQTYLAGDPVIYPAGLVTGFFGPLTQGAVSRFQVAQGIVNSGTPQTTGYGRVGPTTMARINALMAGGVVSQNYDSAPILGGINVSVTNSSATLTWATNEVSTGQVYFDTAYIRADEATGPHQLPFVSGTLGVDVNGSQTSHTVTFQNLASNTTYYYMARSTDSAGNMSMTWPPGSFHTN